MENQNIQYRKLRDPKRAKTGQFSASLLPKPDPNQSQKPKSYIDQIMKRNVVEYQHLLKNPLLHLKQVDWVSKLRQPYSKQFQADEVEFMVPSVFSKTTESWIHYLDKDKGKAKERGFNQADFQAVIERKVEEGGHVQAGVLAYMTNLRNYPLEEKVDGVKEEQQVKKQKKKNRKQFCNVPFKERNEYPKFICKESLKKAKIEKKNQLETAFDGSQNYQPYTQKIVKERNYGIFCTFTTGNQKVSLPGLAWQMGLRS